jgi:ubiquinone/menaquinone biosynthesis C-methylase UbiE
MPSFNLLQSVPKVARDISLRRVDKDRNRAIALKFGREYYDGPREQGYGGYVYDGRWVPIAHRLIERYGLKTGDRVLDIGCAKGFLVKDLRDALPGLEVIGLDISRYALDNAVEGAAGHLVLGSCDSLPFPDGAFDLALAINTVHNLPPEGCEKAIREMVRVAPDAGFIQVDAYRNEEERELFEDWMLTAQTYLQPEEWEAMFRLAGYSHEYYWTILLPDGKTA